MPDIAYVTFEDSGGMLHYAVNLAEAAGSISSVALAVFSGAELADAGQFAAGYIKLHKSASKGLLSKFQKYNIFYYRKKAIELIKIAQPKLVHITSIDVGLYSFVSTLSKRGVKTVYTVHDPEVHEEKRTLWGEIITTYQRKYQMPNVFRKLDAIHVHSVKHRDVLVSLYGDWIRSKIYIVQHGGGIPKTIKDGNQSPPELEITNGNNYSVLFFGRIHPYKGLNILEKAIRIVRARGFSITLIVAGQGDRGTLFGDAHNDNNIINRFIADQEVSRLIEAADVVVLPYLSATQSGVIPLAYAYGKPVICTLVGALEELIVDGETGLLVNPNDDESLADAIIRLSDRDTRQRMGNAARQYLDTHISWRQVAGRHIDIYQKLAVQKGMEVFSYRPLP